MTSRRTAQNEDVTPARGSLTQETSSGKGGGLSVVQVSHLYRPSIGGIENYIYRLNAPLRDRGHEVRTVTTDLSCVGDSPLPRDDEAVYCETTATVFRNPFSVELFRQLRTAAADVYHLHSPWFLPTVEAVHALPTDAPKVMTVHGVVPPRHNWRARLLDRCYKPVAQHVFDHVDRVIVLGDSEREHLRERFDVPAERIKVVPNGIHPDTYDVPDGAVASFRDQYGIDPATPTVLTVGRLVPVKRPQVLVEAITDHLPDRDLDVVIVGSGDPDYVSDLRATADDRFTFLSNLTFDNLKAAYYAADLFAFTGSSEGLPTVILEAMNARLPVVTTPTGAIQDVVTDGENGTILGASPTPNALAAAVESYLNDAQERRAVGRRNREYVRSAFAWDGIASEIESVYESVVAES